MQDSATLKLVSTFGINITFARFLLTRIDDGAGTNEIAKLIATRPKPFVKWVGGKRQSLKQFNELGLYPPSEFNPSTNSYFEPFVGGGAVFFDLLPEKAELSDLNQELVVAYNIIKDNVEELISSLKKHIYDKEYYLDMRAKNPTELSDLDVASRFIYLNRTCFNGMYRVNSKGGFNVPFGRYANPIICDEINLRRVSDSLRNITIKHQDYKEVLKNANKGDFIYFDPPYCPVSNTASFTSYTKEGFFKKEHIELRDTFAELHERGCFVMLSNSDIPFINDLYSSTKGVKISKIVAGRAINSNASKRGKVTEILVTNY